MNMIAVLDADRYYGALDYMENMREEYDTISDNTDNDCTRYYCHGMIDALQLVYEFLAKAEVTSDDV